MLTGHAKIQLGKWSIDTADDAHTELHSLQIRRALNSIYDECLLTVYCQSASGGGLLDTALDAAAGLLGGNSAPPPAFSQPLRGNDISAGDAVSVSLTAADNTAQAFTGELVAIDACFDRITFRALSGSHKLTGTRTDLTFENRDIAYIVKTIAADANVNVAKNDGALSYPHVLVDGSLSIWQHILRFCAREGLACYFNVDGELVISKFNAGTADHTFYYGIDILTLSYMTSTPAVSQVVAYGEGAASTMGQGKWYWLSKDNSAATGTAGVGKAGLYIAEGPVKSKDIADVQALNRVGAWKDRSLSGSVRVLGRPDMELHDTIELSGVPNSNLNGQFQVTGIEHILSKTKGFITFIDFCGQGGADEAGGLLDSLMGAVGF